MKTKLIGFELTVVKRIQFIVTHLNSYAMNDTINSLLLTFFSVGFFRNYLKRNLTDFMSVLWPNFTYFLHNFSRWIWIRLQKIEIKPPHIHNERFQSKTELFEYRRTSLVNISLGQIIVNATFIVKEISR